jgi:hypothetical protein
MANQAAGLGCEGSVNEDGRGRVPASNAVRGTSARRQPASASCRSRYAATMEAMATTATFCAG